LLKREAYESHDLKLSVTKGERRSSEAVTGQIATQEYLRKEGGGKENTTLAEP